MGRAGREKDPSSGDEEEAAERKEGGGTLPIQVYALDQEAPRLRGHSKFSRLFRQRQESPSKLMLPGHAIPGHSSCSIFLACPSRPRLTASILPRKKNIFIIPAVTQGRTALRIWWIGRKLGVHRPKINALKEYRGTASDLSWYWETTASGWNK
ncbi:hypothetical protein KM043_016848 [Ampulex compressa]|nr:hypothetical protein KM043_016848 [Ampulex compressa]